MSLKPPAAPNTPVTLRDFTNAQTIGAHGNGSTNDSAALALAVTRAEADSNGALFIPPGTYVLASQFNLESKQNLEIVGGSQVRDIAGGTTTVLSFTGNPGATSGQLNVKKAKSVKFRNLVFLNSHATFAGYLVDAQNDGGSGATDTSKITFEDCSFFGGAASRLPAAAVYLKNSHTIDFVRCSFYDCQVGALGRAANADYAINISFEKCFFQNNVVAHAKNAGCGIANAGGAGWKFSNCTFEPLSTGAAGTYKHDAGVKAHALSFDNCWFGDISAGTAAQISFSGYCLNVVGCRLAHEAAGGRIIQVDENDSRNIWVVGNYCVGNSGTPIPMVIDFASTSGHNSVFASNYKENVTAEYGGVAIPQTAIEHTQFGFIFGGDAALYQGAAGVLETGAHFRTATNKAMILGTAVGTGGSYLEGFEQSSDPGAPAANAGRLFFKDNGAGKTQLAVRFASGATQVVATEP